MVHESVAPDTCAANWKTGDQDLAETLYVVQRFSVPQDARPMLDREALRRNVVKIVSLEKR